jgi:hypothetical protein
MRIGIAADLPPSIGDEDEMMQVFQNLIDNAIEHGWRPIAPSSPAAPCCTRSAEDPGIGGRLGSESAPGKRAPGETSHRPGVRSREFRLPELRLPEHGVACAKAVSPRL